MLGLRRRSRQRHARRKAGRSERHRRAHRDKTTRPRDRTRRSEGIPSIVREPQRGTAWCHNQSNGEPAALTAHPAGRPAVRCRSPHTTHDTASASTATAPSKSRNRRADVSPCSPICGSVYATLLLLHSPSTPRHAALHVGSPRRASWSGRPSGNLSDLDPAVPYEIANRSLIARSRVASIRASARPAFRRDQTCSVELDDEGRPRLVYAMAAARGAGRDRFGCCAGPAAP